MDVKVGLRRKLIAEELMLLKCGVGEDSWESLGLQGAQTSQSYRKSILNIHWKDWCWSGNSIWCNELTHWKRPWCWQRLKTKEGIERTSWLNSTTKLSEWVLTQLCPTICDPMDCNISGFFPVLHQLLEPIQTHPVSDTIQTISSCHPLLLLPSVFPSIRVFPMIQFSTSGG